VSTIASRLRWLVDGSHGGSVNAAAADVGVPQRTLDAAVRGEHYPRLPAIRKIVAYYGCTLDWLIDGAGSPPVVRPVEEPQPCPLCGHRPRKPGRRLEVVA
jgi:hypothetical protein